MRLPLGDHLDARRRRAGSGCGRSRSRCRGSACDEKTTVSPASSLIGWLPSAMRPSAARGSPCPPVATISTSPRGSAIAVVGIDRLGEILADSRWRLRDRRGCGRASGRRRRAARPVSLRHLAQRLQPRGVGGEGGDEHAALAPSPTASISPSRRSPSEPEASGLNTLVESQTSASTPSSPIAVSSLGGRGLAEQRRRRRASSRRCGRCGRTACRSAARCPRESSARAAR